MTGRPPRQRCSNPSGPGSPGSTNVAPPGSAADGTDADAAPPAQALGGARPPGVLRPVLTRRRDAVAGPASAPRPGDHRRGAGAAGPVGRDAPARSTARHVGHGPAVIRGAAAG